MTFSRREVLQWSAAGLVALAWPGRARARAPYRMAILPYLPAQELHRRFAGVLNWLGGQLGVPIELVVAPDYDTMIAMVGGDEVELAYIGPAPYVEMVHQHGSKRLLGRLETRGSPTFRGVIVAKESGDVGALGDLRGRRFAFGDHQSTMSHLLPHAMLLDAGIGLEDLAGHEFLGSHNNVALGVLSGDFDGGAVKDEVFEKYRPRGLKAVAHTIPVSEQVFLVTDRVDLAEQNRIAEVMADAWNDPEARAALSRITLEVSGFVPVGDNDFDELRGVLETLERAGDQ